MFSKLIPNAFFIVVLVFMMALSFGCAKQEPADLVLKNGKIVTVDESVPEAQA